MAAGQMSIFLVNLDGQPDRLAHMRDQFGRVGLDATRLPAFDGRDPVRLASA
jgi:hypothetical protein